MTAVKGTVCGIEAIQALVNITIIVMFSCVVHFAPFKELGFSFSVKNFFMQNGNGHKCLSVIDKQTRQFMVLVKC